MLRCHEHAGVFQRIPPSRRRSAARGKKIHKGLSRSSKVGAAAATAAAGRLKRGTRGREMAESNGGCVGAAASKIIFLNTILHDIPHTMVNLSAYLRR